MLTSIQSAGVAPEENLRNSAQARNCASEKYTQGRCHQKSKTGVSVAPQKGLVSSKLFFKKRWEVLKIIDVFDNLMKDKYASDFFHHFKVVSITLQMNSRSTFNRWICQNAERSPDGWFLQKQGGRMDHLLKLPVCWLSGFSLPKSWIPME